MNAMNKITRSSNPLSLSVSRPRRARWELDPTPRLASPHRGFPPHATPNVVALSARHTQDGGCPAVVVPTASSLKWQPGAFFFPFPPFLPSCAVLMAPEGKRGVAVAAPPEAAEGFGERTRRSGSRWGGRRWRQRATMNNKFDAWVGGAALPDPPLPLRGAAPPRSLPAAPRRRRLGAGRARGDESRGRAQPRSSPPRARPGPARVLLPDPEGVRARGVGAVVRRHNPLLVAGHPSRCTAVGRAGRPGSRGPPYGPASRSSFLVLRREWGGWRDLWGAGRWRGVCSPEGLSLLCLGAWGAGWERVSKVTVTGLRVHQLSS